VAERFEIGDRVEERVNGIPLKQGRVVAIVEEQGVQILTIEWEDRSRTSKKAADAVRSAKS
jgi:hypothetical protein